MSVLKLYCNKYGDVIGEVKDQEGIKRMYYDKIPKVLNMLINDGVIDRKIEGENLVVNHTNNQVILNDYGKMLSFSEINKYDKKIMEILRAQNYKKIENEKKARKKVQRKSYGKAIVVTASILTISVLASAHTKKMKDIKNLQPTKDTSIAITYEDENSKNNLTESTIITETEKQTKENTQAIEIQPIITEKPSYKNTTNTNDSNKKTYTIDLELEDRTNDEKYINTKNKYGKIITKYANEYGLDPNLVLAIATQERGEHSNEIDPGGGIGLMQVQYGVWINKSISAYNFELGEYETETITDEKLKDLDTNIKIGTMILRSYVEKTNYNLAGSIFAYNKGITSVLGVMGNSINDSGEFDSWIDKASELENGDDFYLWNVGSYMCNKKINIVKNNGEELVFNINNTSRQKVLA